MRYDLSAYQIDWNDPQLNTATPTWGFFAVANGESAESKGVELQLSGEIGDSVTWGFGWAYTDATLTADFVVPDVTFGPTADPGSFQFDGATAPGRAGEHAERLARLAHAGHGRQDVHRARRRLLPVGHGQRAQPRCRPSTSNLDSFQIWGTAFTLAADKWNASLWVKNIFNEEGVTGTFTELYMGTAPDEGYFGNGAKDLISLPRTIGLSFNYNF